jgi:hypothetical protein
LYQDNLEHGQRKERANSRSAATDLNGEFAMRLLYSMLVLFLFASCASAQTLSNPSERSNLTVIQKKWRIEVRNPAVEKDPIQAMSEREREERRRKEIESMNEALNERGMPTKPSSVPVPSPETGHRGITVTYVYEVKVSNTGEKGIRALTWDYVFLEPGTEIEVGRRRFVSKVSISPGSTRNVIVRSATSPTGTINARKAGKKPRDQYSEQVVIQRVEYADSSVWQLGSNFERIDRRRK